MCLEQGGKAKLRALPNFLEVGWEYKGVRESRFSPLGLETKTQMIYFNLSKLYPFSLENTFLFFLIKDTD